jgi:methylglyoxal reductase
MRYMNIGGMRVSALSLGTWEMGGGSVWSGADDDESIRIIHEAEASGVNFIDTAPLYGMGHSEEVISRAVKDRRRKFIIGSKFTLNWNGHGEFQFKRDGYDLYADFSRESVFRDVDGILSRLGSDYLDLLYAHRDIPQEFVPECVDALKSLKKSGKIRAVGLSNLSLNRFDDFADASCLDAVQVKYSILDPENGETYLKRCEERGIAFHAYSVLARGALTGKLDKDSIVSHQAHSVFGWLDIERRLDLINMLERWRPISEKHGCSLANLSMAWALAQSKAVNVAFGVRRIRNLHDSLRSVDVALSGLELAQMDADAGEIRRKWRK